MRAAQEVIIGDSLRYAVSESQRHAVTEFRLNREMGDGKTIGGRVKERRKELGIKPGELAKLTGIAASTLSDLEHDRSKRSTALDVIAHALQTTPAALRGDEKHPSADVGSHQKSAESSLNARETLLIERFRKASEPARREAEAYLAGASAPSKAPVKRLGGVNRQPADQSTKEGTKERNRRSG